MIKQVYNSKSYDSKSYDSEIGIKKTLQQKEKEKR